MNFNSILIVILFISVGINSVVLFSVHQKQNDFTTNEQVVELMGQESDIMDSLEVKLTERIERVERTLTSMNSVLQKDKVEPNEAKDTDDVQTTNINLQPEPKVALLNPVGGEEFCYGDIIDVKWNESMLNGNTVDILLKKPKSLLRLDTVATAEGHYVWNLKKNHVQSTGNAGNATIEPGNTYTIYLQSGSSIASGNESDFFTISAVCY